MSSHDFIKELTIAPNSSLCLNRQMKEFAKELLEIVHSYVTKQKANPFLAGT